MILTAHQPAYMPWLGLFDKIAKSDLYCYLDTVQYQKNDFNNRNKIKISTGEMWLTVPVESKNHLEKKVGEIKIVQNSWQKKHIKSLKNAYQKSPYLNKYISDISEIIQTYSKNTLGELNLAMLKYFLNKLNIKTKIIVASDYSFQGKKSDLILDICKKIGATEYIFGAQGKNYANIDSFTEGRIKVSFQEYNPPTYPQLYGNFIPNLSIVDLLFNVGDEALIYILKEDY